MDDPLAVNTRLDLSQFVVTLREDLQQHPERWENTELERFLEALAAYLHDLPGWCKNVVPEIDPDAPQWRLFAAALAGAAIYE